MADKFVVRPKETEKTPAKSITFTLRIDQTMQDELEALAAKSGRSRNELINMAIRYALDNLEFVPD